MRFAAAVVLSSIVAFACADSGTEPNRVENVEAGLYVTTEIRLRDGGENVDLHDTGVHAQVRLDADSSAVIEVLDTVHGLDQPYRTGRGGSWRVTDGYLDLHLNPGMSTSLVEEALEALEFRPDGDGFVGRGDVDGVELTIRLMSDDAAAPFNLVFPAEILVLGGENQVAPALEAYDELLEVRLLNGYGDPVADYPISALGTNATARKSGSGEWLVTATTRTDDGGRATFELRAGPAAGAAEIFVWPTPMSGVYVDVPLEVAAGAPYPIPATRLEPSGPTLPLALARCAAREPGLVAVLLLPHGAEIPSSSNGRQELGWLQRHGG